MLQVGFMLIYVYEVHVGWELACQGPVH